MNQLNQMLPYAVPTFIKRLCFKAIFCFVFFNLVSIQQSQCANQNSATCNTHTGTFFYADCGGISYYFIELEDGRIFDPYITVDPGFYPYEGQQIRFDFEIKTDVSTPCDISESPINITCYEEIEEEDDEPACSLPLDVGTCDEYIPRYYYSTNRGNCKQFTYSGCGGNANNYENYTLCVNECNTSISCSEGDLLEWRWMQNIINTDNYCSVGAIQQFEYIGQTYYKTLPGDYQKGEDASYLMPCPADFPEKIYDCKGNFICEVSIGLNNRCLSGDFDRDILLNAPIIWEQTYENNGLACNLRSDSGSGDDNITRYFFNPEIGGCQQFTYSGSGGNANNYETYTECINACSGAISCPDGDPLEWDWMQEIISNSDGCAIEQIVQFEFSGNYYFMIGPGVICKYNDPFASSYYDCNGNLICLDSTSTKLCYAEMLEGAQNYTNIWTYEWDCPDPLETSFVQYAMNDGCTEAIYAFDYEGDPYIYIKNACTNFGKIYNCKTTQVCGIEPESGTSSCLTLIESVQPLLNEANAIWTNTCTFENTGTVYYLDNCDWFISCCNNAEFEIASLPYNFNFSVGQIVEFDYELAIADNCLPLGTPVDITCIRKVDEDCGCPPATSSGLTVCGFNGNTYNSTCLANCFGGGVAYDGACKVCYEDDPLQADWIVELIVNDNECAVDEIRQFEYNGATHFAVLPYKGGAGFDRNGQSCFIDVGTTYYDCIGNIVCYLDADSTCDATLLNAANAGTSVWMYNEAGCQNPLDTDFAQEWIDSDFVQEWINASCTRSIYSFEFEGETFIHVEFIYSGVCSETKLLYNCNSGISCYPITSNFGNSSPCYSFSESFYETVLNNDNLIWTKPCAYEETGEVVNIRDHIPNEYIYDDNCDLIIYLSEIDLLISPVSLPDNFTLTEGQLVEFSYRSANNPCCCNGIGQVEIFCIREAGDNQNNMDRIECPTDHTTSICAPVSMPPSMTLQDFSTTDDPNYINSMSLQMEEQTDVQANFNTTARIYTISDESGHQKTCQTKHYIANQFLQAPDAMQSSTICEKELWSSIKIGIDQYKIYGDDNGAIGDEMSTCNTPNLICSTADLDVDTKHPAKHNFWATTYFTFPDGTICESQPAPFYVEIQAKPIAALSSQNTSINIGEGILLMDMVTTNTSGYWTGENIIYLMTASGENIAYFSANETGVYKLYYTVKNENCERNYLLVVEVASAGKAALAQASYKTIDKAFNMYPNPTSHKVFVDLPNEAVYQINLMDISGKVVKQLETHLSDTNIEIDVNDLPKGMYLVELKNEGSSHIQKLVVE